MIRRSLERLQPLALLLLRAALGAIMIAHGYQKVHGGGYGAQLAANVAKMGLPGWLGYFVTYLEFIGGALVLIGLLTRIMGLLYTLEMVVAIWKVHWRQGLTGQGGYEFPLAVGVVAFTLLCFGGGLVSADHLIFGGGHRSRR